MIYDPRIHRRRSVHIYGYDYSRPGSYYITLCIQEREHLLGKISGNKMEWNDAGRMVEKWYRELENKYPRVHCREYVIMPNHIHFIVEISSSYVLGNDQDATTHLTGVYRPSPQTKGVHVGTPLRGRPNVSGEHPDGDGGHPDDPEKHTGHNTTDHPRYGPENKIYNPSLFDIVGWFKTMTTNDYIRNVKTSGWPPFPGQLWQRGYWEHVIRNTREYQKITRYIRKNPANWQKDRFNI